MARTRKPSVHCCIDCRIADVYQCGNNPIIARCDDGTKNVALCPVRCDRFKPLNKIRCIENDYDKSKIY